MMNQIFTVFDSKAQAYLSPFFLSTVGMAIRAFADTVNDKSHMFAKHPEDYTLFRLGEYDDRNATFDLCPSPEPLGKAIEYVNQELPLDRGKVLI